MLTNKVAIITGGTRGIGYAIAKKFLDNNAKVVILGSKEETVTKALEQLKTENELYDVTGYYPNLTSEESVREMFEKVVEQYGKVDILVNNAGVSSRTPLKEHTLEEFDKVCDINIKSAFVCSKVAVDYLTKTKGVILNTSSMVSKYGQPSGVMYPSSKFAINGMTLSLARELAPLGIRVNAVAPGVTKTDMVAALPEEMIKPLIATIPLGRIGEPEDIANAFLFLASDMASYITGQVLGVDGAAKN